MQATLTHPRTHPAHSPYFPPRDSGSPPDQNDRRLTALAMLTHARMLTHALLAWKTRPCRLCVRPPCLPPPSHFTWKVKDAQSKGGHAQGHTPPCRREPESIQDDREETEAGVSSPLSTCIEQLL